MDRCAPEQYGTLMMMMIKTRFVCRLLSLDADAECLLGRLRERLDVEQHKPQPQGLQSLRVPPSGCRPKVCAACAAKM